MKVILQIYCERSISNYTLPRRHI